MLEVISVLHCNWLFQEEHQYASVLVFGILGSVVSRDSVFDMELSILLNVDMILLWLLLSLFALKSSLDPFYMIF